MPDAPHPDDAVSLIAALKTGYETAEGNVTAKQLADVYGVLAAQQEAIRDLLGLVIKVKAHDATSEDVDVCINSVRSCYHVIGPALTRLADEQLDTRGSDG